MSEKKTRTGKITKGQKQKMLEILKLNKKVAMGQFGGGPNSAKLSHTVWESITAELNATGGAFKTTEQYKKTWSDWKVHVKKQQAAIKRFANRTGNLPASEGPTPLDEMDAEVLQFFPPAMLEGDPGKEPGFANFETSEPDDDDLEIEMGMLLDTPKSTATSKQTATSKPTPGSSKPSTSRPSSFHSSFQEIKNYLKENDAKVNNKLDVITDVLKSIDRSLKTLIEK